MPTTYVVHTIVALNQKKITDSWDRLVDIEKSGEATRTICVICSSSHLSSHNSIQHTHTVGGIWKHQTPHSSVTIIRMNKINLCKHSACVQIQLNFVCLCKDHAEVCSNPPALLTLVQALPPCCKISYCTVLQ